MNRKADPRETRAFPKYLNAWSDGEPQIVMGQKGRTLMLNGFQMMQDWERPLMERMAASVCVPQCTVLEIGYGLGVCARAVWNLHPSLHVIVEANRHIARHALAESKNVGSATSIQVLCDFWENVVLTDALKQRVSTGFDAIIFDTFPTSIVELRRNHFAFFSWAARLLGKSGRFTYFSNEKDYLSPEHQSLLERHFPNSVIRTDLVKVEPWLECEYWFGSSILNVVVSNE